MGSVYENLRRIIAKQELTENSTNIYVETDDKEIPGNIKGITVGFMDINAPTHGFDSGIYVYTNVTQGEYDCSEEIRQQISDYVLLQIHDVIEKPKHKGKLHVDLGTALRLMPAYIYDKDLLILRVGQGSREEILDTLLGFKQRKLPDQQ